MRNRLPILPLAAALITPGLHAQAKAPAADDAAIRSLLTHQADDWNRGDIDAFAAGYKNSPDILFMGPTISHGYIQMLDNYKHNYASRARMGTLTFSHLDVQPLDARFATATGNYHLDRDAANGGPADGYFLLVLEKTAPGWKIVRDATTSLPKTAGVKTAGVKTAQ